MDTINLEKFGALNFNAYIELKNIKSEVYGSDTRYSSESGFVEVHPGKAIKISEIVSFDIWVEPEDHKGNLLFTIVDSNGTTHEVFLPCAQEILKALKIDSKYTYHRDTNTISLNQLEALSEETGFYAGFYTDVAIDAEIQRKKAMEEYVAQTKVFTEAEEKLQQLDDELVMKADILKSANYISLAVDISTASNPVKLYKAYLSAQGTELGSPEEKALCGSYEDLMQLGTIILGSRE